LIRSRSAVASLPRDGVRLHALRAVQPCHVLVVVHQHLLGLGLLVQCQQLVQIHQRDVGLAGALVGADRSGEGVNELRTDLRPRHAGHALDACEADVDGVRFDFSQSERNLCGEFCTRHLALGGELAGAFGVLACEVDVAQGGQHAGEGRVEDCAGVGIGSVLRLS
jgi:hypothetical protein